MADPSMASNAASAFMTDPDMMNDYARRFAVHADTIQDDSHRAFASSENIAGAGWFGGAQRMSHTSMEEMMRAFRNIVDMMQWTSDNLARAATEYEAQEAANQASLSS